MLNETSSRSWHGALLDHFMHLGSPVILVDRQGSPVLWNMVASRSMSVVAGERADSLWAKIGLDRSQSEEMEAQLSELFDSGGQVGGELRLSNGRQVEYTMLLLDEGIACQELASLTIVDITEQKMGRGLSEALNLIYQDLARLGEPSDRCVAALERIRAAASADSVAILRRRDGAWQAAWQVGAQVEHPGEPFGDDEVLRDFPLLAHRQVSLLEDRALPAGEAAGRPGRGGVILAAPLTIGSELVGAVLVSLPERRFVHPIQMDFFYKAGLAISSSLERQGLQEELEERAEILREVVDRYPGIIALLQYPSMEVEVSNDRFQEFISSHLDETTFPPPTMDRVKEIIDAAVTTRTVRSGQEFQLMLDEQMHTWSYSIVPMELGTKFLLVTFDVTEQVNQRRRFEELALQEEEGRVRLKAILETIPVGILVVNESGQIEVTNEQRAEIWGGRPPVTDLNDLSQIHGVWSETGLPVTTKEWPLYRAWRFGDSAHGAMIDIKRSDGSMGTILASSVPVKDHAGNVIGAIGTLSDITRQRRLEQDAIEAKQKMELYLDVLSHDVNNLNAAASGYLQLFLKKEVATAAGRKYLESIDSMLRDIGSLIENINKIQSLEQMGRTRSLTDLGLVLEDSVTAMERTPGRDVKIDYRPVLKSMVMGNELLRDLFDNLIGNAVKHSPDPVRIRIGICKMLIEAREFYRVEIEDNGPGIPGEMKTKLFNRFQRGSSKAHGRGLGLYLVKKITEEFGGKVWVEDRAEGDWTGGARFVVCLPVAQVSRSDLVR